MTSAEHLNATTLLDGSLDAGAGGAPALITDSGVLSYDDVAALVGGMAAYLTELRVQREQRVLMVLDDSPAFYATFLGAMRIGAVPVPVNPLDRIDNHVYYLEDSYAQVVVIDEALSASLEAMLAVRPGVHVMVVGGVSGAGARVAFDDIVRDATAPLAAPADTHRDDMAFWLYSSGSTGRPKGVVHSHGDIAATIDSYARNVLRISPADRCYSTTKLFHAYGLGNSLSFPLSVGASVVLKRGRATPPVIFETVAEHRPTLFFSVPALYAAMLKAAGEGGAGAEAAASSGRAPEAARPDFSSVRACVSAAEALPAAVLSRWIDLAGVPILDGIGSTEMLHIYCSNTMDEVTPGTSGRPVPGYELRLIDETGQDVAPGTPGDLLVHGDSCASLYWHQRQKTRFCMRGEWFYTGDRYIQDESGHFVYQGRADDMIKTGGLWVSPADVEACLVRHPSVSEAAVIGMQVEHVSRIKAFVICSAPPRDAAALADELRTWCKQNLRRYEYPHLVEFVEDLPRTVTGKVQRFRLREAEQAKAVAGVVS